MTAGKARSLLWWSWLAALCVLFSIDTVRAEDLESDPVAEEATVDRHDEQPPPQQVRVRQLSELSKPCIRCHGMATLAYRDLRTGEFRNLSVSKELYLESNHGEMDCYQCHSRRYFKSYPHRASSRQTALHCFDCHKSAEKMGEHFYNFDAIDQQFRESVHFRALPDTFSCFSCHDPHRFEVAYKQKSIADIITQDNGFCLKCHGNRTTFSSFTKREFPELHRTHSWLPKAERHWHSVRCVECHTPQPGDAADGDKSTETAAALVTNDAEGKEQSAAPLTTLKTSGISHKILGRKEVKRNCVLCHRKDSLLLTQLYQYHVTEKRERSGILGSMMQSEAYIIGMTRSAVLDMGAVLLIGITLLAIGGHALARFVVHIRQGGHHADD